MPDLEAPLPEVLEQQPEEDAPRLAELTRDPEAPEADALEQAALVEPATEHFRPRRDPEVPEADALEQATVEFDIADE